MVNYKYSNKYIQLYKDFLHPNPNINSQAILPLRGEFRVEFMNNLLTNLKEEDIVIRRKSILALGEYGEEIFNYVVPLYLNSKKKMSKLAVLK